MEYENNRVVKILKTKYPLIQAPMIWVTSAKMIASVSNAGGLGVLGLNAGYRSVVTDPKLTAERMRKEIRKTKKLTKNSFAVNIVLPYEKSENTLEYSDKILEVCLEEEIKYFVVSGDIREEYFNKIKKENGIIIYRPINPTTNCMRKAESLGADILVATGYDEGGLLPNKSVGTFTVVPMMVDAVHIPLLAAGGINDRRGVKAAFALGAEGVFIGSRFIVTKESPASTSVKNKIANSNCEDIVEIDKIFRTLKTEKIKNIMNNSENLHKIFPHILSSLRLGFLSEDDLEEGLISINTGINLIYDIPSIKELVKRLMED